MIDSSDSESEDTLQLEQDIGSGSPRYTPPLPEGELLNEIDPLLPGNQEHANGTNTDEEEEVEEYPFDINLPAEHSYLPSNLVAVVGRSVLEPGWEGKIPCRGHNSCVFPGETLPMMCRHHRDIAALREAIASNRLFGLLCPDETGMFVSSYGVLCEVYEATMPGRDGGILTFKARARQRFRFVDMPRVPHHINLFMHVVKVNIRILPDILTSDPLTHSRLFSLDRYRLTGDEILHKSVRKYDSLVTPWPSFVYDIFDLKKATDRMRQYFKELGFNTLPTEMVSLSFWVASNLSLSVQDRLVLFTLDNATLRLHLELQHINRKCVLYCTSCAAEITRKDYILAMSSEGLHANYCNLGGYIHDIFTVSRVTNVVYHGRPSMEFTWFPGYAWTIIVCQTCGSHVGWRYSTSDKRMKPREFWAVRRNYIVPKDDVDDLEVRNGVQ